MKRKLPVIFAGLFLTCTGAFAQEFIVNSPDLKHQEALTKANEFNGFGCSGMNIAPEIRWDNAPKGTKSFAYTVYDPDAPTGSGWWHYLAYNIPAKARALNVEKLPKGTLIVSNDAGQKEFMGPCPPIGHGVHHYHFKVYALKVEKLDLPDNATAAYAGYMINQNKLAEAEIVGTYERK